MKRLIGVMVVIAVFAVIGAVGVFSFGSYLGHGGEAAEHAAHDQEEGYWTCAMHPQVRQSGPGRCPLCGMDLYHKEPAAADVIEVSEEMRGLIGIATVPVETTIVGVEVRAAGRVEIDERRRHRVHTRVMGWIEDLHVDFAGAFVRRGENLLKIYSPQLFSTGEEYLIALEAGEMLSASPDPDARARAQSLASAARMRLELFNIPEEEIARLERERTASQAVILSSPASGVVTEIMVRRGTKVDPGMALFEIADLSAVWIVADVYENEMTSIRVGMEANATFRQLPGKVFTGRIDYVYPTLDMEARTNRLRMTIANPGLALRPGMFGDVTLSGERREALVAPLDAVVRTGTRDMVYVETEPGVFSPRAITLGPQLGDHYEVAAGLAAGERVVAKGVYFLDSEASIRAAALEGRAAAHCSAH